MYRRRPEKDHISQIQAFHQLLEDHPEYRSTEKDLGVRLVLVGGSRNDGDAARVAHLRKMAGELGIEVRIAPQICSAAQSAPICLRVFGSDVCKC